MRKSIYTLMVSTLIAAASMTACSSQPSETTTAETTAAESTQENLSIPQYRWQNHIPEVTSPVHPAN